MPRIKNKIYKWISSIPHRNMEDKETEPISGSPAKSLPLTDWKKAFPMLSRYASNKLLIRQDIVLIGLCFQRMKMIKTYYRPLLTAFPLWKKTIDECMWPLFEQSFHDNRHIPLDIPIEQHQQRFHDSVKYVESQSWNLLKENVKVRNLFDFLDYHRNTNVLLLNMFSMQADFLKYRLITALYLQDKRLIQKACEHAEKEMSLWKNYSNFEETMGKLDTWRSEFYQLVDQREEIMERIRINSMDKRIAKLKESHFII